jgi:predicted Zn-dependent protease
MLGKETHLPGSLFMPDITRHFAQRLALAGIAATALSLCVTPASAQRVRPGDPISPAEAQLGAQNHEALVSEFGGAMSGPQADYVVRVGQGIAVQSGLATRPDAFRVTLLNSPVNNAFAVPGGYVYITRQLVGLMNNEAELAAVLGHEVGHVAARHSARRERRATRNTLLGGAAAILSGVLLGGNNPLGQQISQAALQGSQLLTLKFSRTQELEADNLGVQYLTGAGYDPRAMASLLSSLAAQNTLDAQLMGRGDASMPAWASTHPDPASRVRNALTRAGTGTGITNRETFLQRVDGLMYGDDPAQGVIEGQQFIHPDLRLSFAAPAGFFMVNSTRAVSIQGDAGRAQFSTGPFDGNLETYVRAVFQALGGEQQLAPQSLQRSSVNGLPTVVGGARVDNGQQQVDVSVIAYDFGGGKAYHFAAITPAGQATVFNPMFNSMRRVTAQEAAQVVPRAIDVVTASRTDTVQTLARRMAYADGQEARFRVLNGLDSTATVVPGQQYKIVVRSR